MLGTATGFMDVKLHPDFATNGLIYLAYHKPAHGEYGNNAIFRGRWNGTAIVDGKDIFVGDDVDALYTKMAFGPDGKLYFTIGCPGVGTDESIGRAQKPDDYAGKTLRLNDDGTIPKDNPFAGKQGYNPEIFTLGHRVNLGLALNPVDQGVLGLRTRPAGRRRSEHPPPRPELWLAGRQRWPLLLRHESLAVPYKDGMTRPHISYVPSIAPGGMVFYTGDKFPGWKRNLFVGAMRMSNSPRTGHLERIVFNENWEVIRSEMLLFDLHQRIRDVEQSPDGYLYVITDEGADSVLLRLEPGSEPELQHNGERRSCRGLRRVQDRHGHGIFLWGVGGDGKKKRRDRSNNDRSGSGCIVQKDFLIRPAHAKAKRPALITRAAAICLIVRCHAIGRPSWTRGRDSRRQISSSCSSCAYLIRTSPPLPFTWRISTSSPSARCRSSSSALVSTSLSSDRPT